jgi:hypothetical protein
MTLHHPDDPIRFFHSDQRFTWTDIARLRYLKKLATTSTSRLDVLRLDSIQNAEDIAREQAVFESTAREIERLESTTLTM